MTDLFVLALGVLAGMATLFVVAICLDVSEKPLRDACGKKCLPNPVVAYRYACVCDLTKVVR